MEIIFFVLLTVIVGGELKHKADRYEKNRKTKTEIYYEEGK